MERQQCATEENVKLCLNSIKSGTCPQCSLYSHTQKHEYTFAFFCSLAFLSLPNNIITLHAIDTNVAGKHWFVCMHKYSTHNCHGRIIKLNILPVVRQFDGPQLFILLCDWRWKLFSKKMFLFLSPSFSEVLTHCRLYIYARHWPRSSHAVQNNSECSKNWLWVEAEMSIYCIWIFIQGFIIRLRCSRNMAMKTTLLTERSFFSMKFWFHFQCWDHRDCVGRSEDRWKFLPSYNK